VLLGRLCTDFPALRGPDLESALIAAGWQPVLGKGRTYAPPGAVEPQSESAPPPPASAAAVPAEASGPQLTAASAGSAPAATVWPPVMAGPIAMPPGTICSACSGRRWWVSRTGGPAVWRCCQCAPLSGHLAAAGNWFF